MAFALTARALAPAASAQRAIRPASLTAPLRALRSQTVVRPAYKRTVAFKTGDEAATTKKIDIDFEQIKDSAITTATEYAEILKAKWTETDEKPAVVAISFAAFIAIWATSGVIDAVDRLPLIGSLLEVVGLFVTAWAVYRYTAFPEDREDVQAKILTVLAKIGAK